MSTPRSTRMPVRSCVSCADDPVPKQLMIRPRRLFVSFTSNWLEVKMETDESSDPDRSPPDSSPDTSPHGISIVILSPPSAFADLEPGHQTHGTSGTLQNRNASFTVPTHGFSSQSHPEAILSTEAIRSNLTPLGDDPSSSGVSSCLSCSRPAVTVIDSVTSIPHSMLNATSPLQQRTPFSMATTSVMNSTFSVRSPSSVVLSLATSSTQRTPSIVVTDSIMGNSTFAVQSTNRTPSIVVTDSVMGNSTFAVQSANRTPSIVVTDSVMGISSFAVQSTNRTPSIVVTDSVMGTSSFTIRGSTPAFVPFSAANSTPRTPSILATNSVMGNSSMRTPTPDLPQTITQQTSSTDSKTGTSSTHDPLPSRCVQPVLPDRREPEQAMEVTPAQDKGIMHELEECQARMDSIKDHDRQLKEELVDLKSQFFNLLDNLGLSHDVYYDAQTPAETPSSRLFESQVTIDNLRASFAQFQPPVSTVSHLSNVSGKVGGMNTPRSTPRRGPCGRRAPENVRSIYADLLIDQLLAKAQTDSSDQSNSPPDPEDTGGPAVDSATTSTGETKGACSDHALDLPDSTSVHRHSEESEEPPCTDSTIKPKDIPVSTGPAAADGYEDPLQQQPGISNEDGCAEDQDFTIVSQVLVPSNDSTNSAPTCSSTSSGNRSVPDLDKELVSRIQYYSDFTIDRQKKIDEAVDMPDVNEENSPSVPSEQSSENISQRCVEGSESVDHFLVPLAPVPAKAPVPVAPVRTTSVSGVPKNALGRSRNTDKQSDMCESDTSSGTGSMPHSQQSSHHSSRHNSKHSSRDRHSAHSSSGDRRSSSRSSRGSRCSTHPLASSTLISDPTNSGTNSGSAKSGSVYTWSLDNSSDENLQQSFLRSEKRSRRRSRKTRRQSKSSHSPLSTASRPSSHSTAGRPVTLIGADSPPEQLLPGDGNSLHLTHMISMIDSPSRRFGGRSYENSTASLPTPRSASLPRTSTRIGCLVPASIASCSQKAFSVPELSNPTFQDMNCAVARIGPSNLSSDLQHTVTEGSTSPCQDRPDLPGKSSTSGSVASYFSQCSTCNPPLVVSPATSSPMKMVVDPADDDDDALDEILTNSARSYDSSGVHPPYNSYTSPAGSTNEYTTISDSSTDCGSIITSAPHQPRAFAVKSPGVFKVPFSPASRTVKRSKAGAGNLSTHNVGVRAIGTPHLPLGLVKHNFKEPVSRRKLFGVANQAQAQTGSNSRAPKILDRKALVRKFKKFSNNFKKDKDSAKIQTLANL